MRMLTLAAMTLIVLLPAPIAHAGNIPQTMSYQGFLTMADGSIANDGTYTIDFRLWSSATGGLQLWFERQGVLVSQGSFSVIIGQFNMFNLRFDEQYWLELTIVTPAPITTLTPRIKLAASPYSLNTRKIDLPYSDVITSSDTVLAISNLGTGRGIHGFSTGDAGIWGASRFGNGVVGVSDSSDGIAGYAKTAIRSGVYGQNTFAGTGDLDPPAYGIAGLAAGVTGRGVMGFGGAYGVFGESPSGPGVYGIHTGPGLASVGIYGTSTNGYGVQGKANATSAAGILAENGSAVGPALEILRGSLKVNGAGLNTNTTAFIAKQTLGGQVLRLNHLLINGDPTAILMVTPRTTVSDLPNTDIYVCYGCAGEINRWAIATMSGSIPISTEYNVLIIKTQ